MIAYSLLLLLGLVVALGGMCVALVLHWLKTRRLEQARSNQLTSRHPTLSPEICPTFFEPPSRWIAIKQNDAAPVQRALQLQSPQRCTLEEGFTLKEEDCLFVTPSLDSWVLVMGPVLIQLSEEPDLCFHFMRRLSYHLGLVQFFTADRIVNHHSWVIASEGEIVRAYTWTGETVWNQGTVTRAEKKLGLVCYDYGERSSGVVTTASEPVRTNVDKVHMLAGQWSIDPTHISPAYSHAEAGTLGQFDLHRFVYGP